MEKYQTKITMFCCSPIQGQGPNSCHEQGTDLSNSFQFFKDFVPIIKEERYTEMLVQHFPINPDTHGNIVKLLNNILNYGCSPIQGNISNFYPFHAHVFFLSKTVSKNQHWSTQCLSIDVQKEKYFVLVKKVIKMSKSVKKRY